MERTDTESGSASNSPQRDAARDRRPGRWDLFCRVVDNLGDAGVCWRLARALAARPGARVRLYIDEPIVLAPLAGGDPAQAPGIDVYRWDPEASSAASVRATGAASPPGELLAPAQIDAQWCDVVIAAFACRLPEAYLRSIADRDALPVWINLEYLSAEAWIEASHGLASPHPRLPLTEHFYFPGFTAATGGLLREPGLLARRDAWQADPHQRERLAQVLGLPAPEQPERWISLFCYAHAELAEWLDALVQGPGRVRVLVTEGDAREALVAAGLPMLATGRTFARGQLELSGIRFLPQDGYDELLWSCDLNVVRGEDSFVRAQWAARPFVWQPYRQAEDAHLVKLRAFTARYLDGMPAQTARPIDALFEAWNTGAGLKLAWPRVWDALASWQLHAAHWSATLATAPDLDSRLVQFCADRIKC